MPEQPTTPFSGPTLAAYAGLADWLVAQHRGRGLKVIGINGAQGSGKSALARFLVGELQARHGLLAVTVSIDDFYLGRVARTALADTVHPLLRTRGVPGTHDVQRGIECLHMLRTFKPGKRCAIPAFSKARDDALPAAQERMIETVPDLILFEGWCVGTPAQSDNDLSTPINALERDADAFGSWRHHVNQQLAGPYARWFSAIDALVFLAVPGWEQVREWRAQQERETAAHNNGTSALRTDAELDRFLQHYQRLTAHALATLPGVADVELELDVDHGIADIRYR